MLGGTKCINGLTRLARPTIGLSARFAQESVINCYVCLDIFTVAFFRNYRLCQLGLKYLVVLELRIQTN